MESVEEQGGGTPARASVEGAPAQETARHDAYAALRESNYRWFASGWFLSTTGQKMAQTAVAWELYERTRSALALGYIGLVQALPVVLLSLPAGHAADSLDRRRMVMVSQVGFALLALALAICSRSGLPVSLIYVLLGLMGCVKAFSSPARASLFPRIVPTRAFQNAVTWNSGVFHLSAIVGPTMAGALIHLFGAAWPVYAITAVGTTLFAISILFVRDLSANSAESAVAATKRGVSLRGMLAGIDFLRDEKTVLAAIALDLFAVLVGGATTLLPIFAKSLGVESIGYGALRAAPYLGALAMAVALAHRPPFRRSGPTLLLAVAGFGACTILFGLSRSFPLSLLCLFALGALDNISVVIRHVLVQVRTPDALRGRVSAVNTVFIESSNELGGFESGLVASWFGPVVSVVSGGIGTLGVVAFVAWRWPEIRRLRELHMQA